MGKISVFSIETYFHFFSRGTKDFFEKKRAFFTKKMF